MLRIFAALSVVLLLSACGSAKDDDDDQPTGMMRLKCGGLRIESGFTKFDVTSDNTGTVLLYNDPDSGAPSMRSIPPGHRCEITAEPKD
ncbi:MAG TPA: hypothetical protein VN809_10660 [Telmatospirillum sp.]|nr:hypothetical protein [Telmatospirillum sp.]